MVQRVELTAYLAFQLRSRWRLVVLPTFPHVRAADGTTDRAPPNLLSFSGGPDKIRGVSAGTVDGGQSDRFWSFHRTTMTQLERRNNTVPVLSSETLFGHQTSTFSGKHASTVQYKHAFGRKRASTCSRPPARVKETTPGMVRSVGQLSALAGGLDSGETTMQGKTRIGISERLAERFTVVAPPASFDHSDTPAASARRVASRKRRAQ